MARAIEPRMVLLLAAGGIPAAVIYLTFFTTLMPLGDGARGLALQFGAVGLATLLVGVSGGILAPERGLRAGLWGNLLALLVGGFLGVAAAVEAIHLLVVALALAGMAACATAGAWVGMRLRGAPA